MKAWKNQVKVNRSDLRRIHQQILKRHKSKDHRKSKNQYNIEHSDRSRKRKTEKRNYQKSRFLNRNQKRIQFLMAKRNRNYWLKVNKYSLKHQVLDMRVWTSKLTKKGLLTRSNNLKKVNLERSSFITKSSKNMKINLNILKMSLCRWYLSK